MKLVIRVFFKTKKYQDDPFSIEKINEWVDAMMEVPRIEQITIMREEGEKQ